MGQSGSANGQFGCLDAQTVSARAAGFFRALYPRDTAKLVARDTGVPAATIAKWLARSSAPSAGALLACCMAYGPAFLSAVCPGLRWVEAALSLTNREALARALDAADAEAEAALAELRGRKTAPTVRP